MYAKLKEWFKKEYQNDPFEMSAAAAFGIGFPVIIVIFVVILYMLK